MRKYPSQLPACSLTAGFALALYANPAIAQIGGGTDPSEDILLGYLVSVLVLLPIVLAIYLIPLIVAFVRHHPNRWMIAVVNIALGGTGIGWLGSLVWAFSAVDLSPTGSDGGESGLNIFANDPVKIQVDPALPVSRPDEVSADELVRLKQLLDAGVIDEVEYRHLRAGPLGRLAGWR